MLPARTGGVGSLSFVVALLILAGVASANPTGGRVVTGSATIQSSGPRLDVAQQSERLGIEWRDFSIGRGEQVNFDQPSRSAVALNRVVGNAASNIEGLLTANGNIFVVNRNGVVFHRSAVVDVGGLLATTTDISNADFLAGRYRFDRPADPAGRVVNEGTIRIAEGGLVALVAPGVRNAGVIEARMGRVVLGSGLAFTLDLYGDELVTFAVHDKVAKELLDEAALVDHSGTIDAPGGRVWLTASAARAVVNDAINLSGVVRARTVAGRDGRIVLQGGEGDVRVSGQVDASSGAGDAGGGIEVLGGSVELAGGSTLDASGGTGGGTVLVGGDYQGKGARRRAVETTVKPGAVVRADATGAGDGGTIVIWSDGHTVVDGAVSARGGPDGGDGGLVETSSAGKLEFNVPVKVSAPKGRAGTWLLDPEDIDIDRGKADSIEATLNEGGNVSIKTSDQGGGEGNISVNASITKTDGDDAKLSLEAHNRIDVNKPIRSEAGKLKVSLKAGRSVNVKADIETNGGGFSSSVTGVKTPQPAANTETGEIGDDIVETESDDSDSNGDETGSDTGGEPAEVADNEAGTPDVGESPSPVSEKDPVEQGSDTANEGSDPGGSATKENNPTEGVESTEHVAATASGTPGGGQSHRSYILVEQTVATRGGDLSVDAGDEGMTVLTGSLDSSNTEPGRTGGDIEVLGQHVVLAKEAVVDASGEAGGGDIHVGGDYQGQGERRNAQTTTVGERVTIRSDATGEGDAGMVVVWSDDTTRFSGDISARGGTSGGDGGTIEVSGKKNLGFHGTADAGAPKGIAGTLLLDPEELTIIDAERGGGDQDLNVLCTSFPEGCFMPPAAVFDHPGGFDWTIELLESFGIDPDPNTPLNTLSWGRIIQVANATLRGIYIEADGNVTFAPLNGTVSTRGSPTGSNRGWTITLELADPGRSVLDFSVKSKHGDIVFQDRTDNLVVINQVGSLIFEAAEGNLMLGNLYSAGKPAMVPGVIAPGTDNEQFFAVGWTRGNVRLTAAGDIDVGVINTRVQPGRLTNPMTGAPLPQPFVIGDTDSFDVGIFDETRGLFDDPNDVFIFPPNELFDPAFFTDPARGGAVNISSTGGNVNIHGPVHTGSGNFLALADGEFAAGVIDTGANRLVVENPDLDDGSVNTLFTGAVDIAADKITFERINAGSVTLEARVHAEDAIAGEVVFDTFRNSDFIGGRPQSMTGRPASNPGLTILVGDTPGGDCSGNCVDNLVFSLGNLGELGQGAGDALSLADLQLGLDGSVTMDLTDLFTFLGGDDAADTRHVPRSMFPSFFQRILAPSAAPIEVPLGLPVQSPVAVAGGVLRASPLPTSPATNAGGAGGQPGVVFVESTEASSADMQRIRNPGDDEQVTKDSVACPGDERLEWLKQGARSAARDLDWGRRAAIGAGPEDTGNVFDATGCYFAG